MAPLQHYVESVIPNGTSMSPLTYYFNMQVHLPTGTTSFSPILSLPSPGRTTANPVREIPDDMTDQTHLKTFCSRFLRQFDLLRRQMESKCTTDQALRKCNFAVAVRRTSGLYRIQQVFLDRSPARMIESARMLSVLHTKALPNDPRSI